MKFTHLLLAAALLTMTGCSTATMTHGVPNLAQVDPGVWRSGQPATKEAWQYLWSLGIRKVVKLNFESEDSEQAARDAGFEVVYLPIEPDEDLLHTLERPDPANVAAAVAVLSAGGGVIVKCRHGQDRTGYVTGRYRVVHDHWSKRAAYEEMLSRGFHPELLGLRRAWDEFAPPKP